MKSFLIETTRPVPRWVRIWSYLTAAVALLLLFVLGGSVTSHRAGMADPVWPTKPWYLVDKDWNQLGFGFLIEHSHRAAGFTFGAMASVLALGAWASEPNPRLRWLGLAAIVLLLVLYGQFHAGMTAVKTAREAGSDFATIPIPVAAGSSTMIAAIMCLSLCAGTVASGTEGRWVRAMAVVVLIVAMIQGLLGGFRVLYDQLAGSFLAAVHGVFAQVVFAVLAAVAFLTGPRREGDALPNKDRQQLGWLALAVPVAVFTQLIWGVWLRHYGSPNAQRLHVLTAFVVAGLIVWLVVCSFANADRRKQLAFGAWHLLGIMTVQILLGVEGWLSKYVAEIDPYTGAIVRVGWVGREVVSATVRTGHVVIGTALLASTVIFALRTWRFPVGVDPYGTRSSIYMDSGVRLGEPLTQS